MTTALWLVLSLVSALALHLASPHQHLRPVLRSHARALRIAAGLAAAGALAAAIVELGIWAGVFAMLTAWMLGVVVLPYLDAWRRARREHRDVG
ncbi:hypothetical protein ACQQ2N_03460 [Dokdonella sp. MW10]|uniref:hypothetical protein n=1 Tax=Dokdonella sp. MW10 TaxID=2992926 RepID=UPI003F7E6BD8